jgi:hypothetical protein
MMDSFEPVIYPNHEFEPTNETIQLNKSLINGFIELGLDPDDIKENYKYSGGDYDSHLNYYKLIFNNNMPSIQKTTQCVCKVKIVHNCYITKNNDIDTIIVIGNCCIKRFMKHTGRTCDECDEPHKNRLMNKCNDCKKKYNICECGKIINKKYKSCFTCKNKSIIYSKKCNTRDCHNVKKEGFMLCYKCNLKKKEKNNT